MPNPPLGQLRVVDPRDVWKNEEKDFTPWIAENIVHLSEAIGIRFIVDQTEKRVGAYELDIYGRVEGSDAPVIIENQLLFWGDLLSFLASKGHGWAKGRKAPKDSWISSPVGKSGVGVNVSMAMGSRMRIEIYCGEDRDKSLFKTLSSHRTEIEALVPAETVSWEPLEDAYASRVAVYRPYVKEEVSEDTQQRRDLFEWIEKNLSCFRDVARKYLD